MGVLVTGVAGCLGLHVAEALLARGETVVGIDDLNPGYDPALKEARLRQLTVRDRFTFARGDVADAAFLARWAEGHGTDIAGVVHLAGPGHAATTMPRRLEGHLALLDLCRQHLPALRHLVYALPGAGGPAAEAILSRACARLHGMPQTGLRLAGLYGPWNRPDSLCQVLADAIAAGRPVTLPETGGEVRLAWAGDVAAAVVAALDHPPAGAEPHRLLDLRGPEPVAPGRLLALLEAAMGRQVERRPGAAVAEEALDGVAATSLVGWAPAVGIEEGVRRFVAWHRERHPAG
jgi:UDP-glucuronate 4-epimerase